VLFAPIPPPSETRPELGTAFDDVALRALDRDPAKRFASAKEMRDALAAAHAHASADEVHAFIEKTAAESIRKRSETIAEIRARSPSIDAELVKEEIIGGFDADHALDYEEDSHLETVKAPTPFDEISETKPRLLTPMPATLAETPRPSPKALAARQESGERIISAPHPRSDAPPPVATPKPKSDWGIVLLLLAFIAAAAIGAVLASMR
jgi:serine/threonine-protein kinase